MKKSAAIFKAQFEACQRQLKAGKLLTAAQMRFVADFTSKKAKSAKDDDGEAASLADLARQLGIPRQVLTWHSGRSEAPETLSVTAWRNYLLARGRAGTIRRLGSAPLHPAGDTIAEIITDTGLALFRDLSNALPAAIADTLLLEQISIPPEKLAILTLQIWLRLAGTQQHWAQTQRVDGVLDADGDGLVEYPKEIVLLCSKIPEISP